MYKVISSGTVEAFPPGLTKTGTVSSSGVIVTGTGTDFFTDIFNTGGSVRSGFKYKWLYSAVNGETREIVNVTAADKLIIKSAFSSALSSENFMLISDAISYDKISINPKDAGPKLATAGGISYLMDENVTKNIDNQYDFPIVINAVGADVEVLS